MFPVPEQCRELLGRFPRVRGDVPRGGAVGGRTPSVFPACAGMFPTEEELDRKAKGFPRVRGDVPSPQMLPPASWWFSPRARGCSCKDQSSFAPRCVFPACAGMFPSRPPLAMFSACFPRVRGDVPCGQFFSGSASVFSPRARGCSWVMRPEVVRGMVFPACAGMFPWSMKPIFCRVCFPRVRGDVPPQVGAGIL